MSPSKFYRTVLFFTVIVIFCNTALSSDKAVAVKISGGEFHSLVLTQNRFTWGCGFNSYYQLGIGCKGDPNVLVRTHGPNDVNFLADINDISAGYIHSLALDVNGFVWAWGDLQWMMCMGGGGGGFGLKGMSLESSLTASTGNRDALMLSTAIESLNARPQRLVNKSQKFYDVTAALLHQIQLIKADWLSLSFPRHVA